MSVRINLNDLSEEQKTAIRKHLYLQPKRTNFTANRFSAVEKDPILFYWIDKPNNTIVLPYSFANSLLGMHVNSLNSYPPGSFNFKGKLRPEQEEPIKQAVVQLNERGTTTLALPTGFGKSLISIVLGSILMNNGTGGLMMILTNRETIQSGWLETIRTETDAGVWLIDSKMKIPEKCNIILTMDGKFEKIPWEIRKLVSILVIDEFHLFCVPSAVPVLLGTTPKYIIGCSATLERTDDMHRMAYAMVGLHKVEVKNNKKFTVYKMNTGIKSEMVKNKQGTTDFSALTRDLAFNPKRNAFIVDFIEQNKHLKFLILSWSKDHVKLLAEVLKSRGESVDTLAGTKSTYYDSRVLIGTVSKISTGFDPKNVSINFNGICIDTLILCASTKSHNLHIQSIGRCFRASNPTIIDVVDSNTVSASHWRERRKNYEELNCEIIELNMNKDVINEEEVSAKSAENMHQSRLQVQQEKQKKISQTKIVETNQKVLEGGDTISRMHAERLKALQEKMR